MKAKFFQQMLAVTIVMIVATSSVAFGGLDARISSQLTTQQQKSYYQQGTWVFGSVPVVASSRVKPMALNVLKDTVLHMLAAHPEYKNPLMSLGLRFAVVPKDQGILTLPEYAAAAPYWYAPAGIREEDKIEYWNSYIRGFSPTEAIPVNAIGEENILCLPGYASTGERLLVHEFSHAIHNFSIAETNLSLYNQISWAYADAMKKGLWHNTYSTVNKEEYFAEGAQAWFDAKIKGPAQGDGVNNNISTRAQLKTYDPKLAGIMKQVFGDTTWRPKCTYPY